MKLSKLFRIKDTIACTLLTAAALLAASNAEAADLVVSEVEYAAQIDSFTPLQLSCKATNGTQENLQTGISVSLTNENAYGERPVATTSVRSIDLEPAGSATVTFDEHLNWLINWPPEAGEYTLNITEEGTNDILYSGTLEFLSESLTINVTEPGTLPQLIGADRKYHITSLTLSGELNGTDIRLLREMAGSDVNGNPTEGKLSSLDMRNARITTGGDYYQYSDLYGYQYTAPECLSHFMFHNCSALRFIAMPSDTKIIGQWALTNTSLENVVFSDCLTDILPYAFVNARISTVCLPESVERIGESAFAKCDCLAEVYFGKMANQITTPFDLCPSLRKITVSAENAFYRDIDGVLFTKDGETLLTYPNARGEEYTMPGTTLHVESKAFYFESGIRKVTCSDSLVDICRGAFSGSSIESIDLGNHLETVGEYAFNECRDLTEIKLPASTCIVSEGAFLNCSGLAEVTCLSPVPPVADDISFMNICPEATLYVPAGQIDSYRNANVWKEFWQIKAESSGVSEVTSDDAGIVGIYSADGKHLSRPCKGINIYRMSDGSIRKVLNR